MFDKNMFASRLYSLYRQFLIARKTSDSSLALDIAIDCFNLEGEYTAFLYMDWINKPFTCFIQCDNMRNLGFKALMLYSSLNASFNCAACLNYDSFSGRDYFDDVPF